MHGDHEVFQRGISQSRKVKLTFFSDELGRELVRPCGPLYYSSGRNAGDGLACYYLWDFGAGDGYNFTALSPSEIISMELTEDTFKFDEIRDSRQRVANLKDGPYDSDS